MKGLAFIQDPDGYWIEILSPTNAEPSTQHDVIATIKPSRINNSKLPNPGHLIYALTVCRTSRHLKIVLSIV